MFGSKKSEMVTPEEALPGRSEPMPLADVHFVSGTSLYPPFPEGTRQAVFGMGCFWGAERIFWQIPGVYTTAAGYAGGYTPNPTYEETCTGRTGHTEAVLVVYDPEQVTYERLLKDFWEQHDPTQYMGQGNDHGSQYRSALSTFTDEQLDVAKRSRDRYQALLDEKGFGPITTEIGAAGEFYYAEEYHQQYLAKNPGGYCNHGFCQVSYPEA
ncbi:MAG: peptide-methionine (S)-S-oxide reductase MsrA [Acidimicrobiia bacterium]|nr:peptide-methionine (S)-S-oxide reductase MsrA [Acidimicrobiia bacterium]